MSMRKVLIISFFMAFLFSQIGLAEKVADLPDIMKPTDSMLVHDGRLYLTEDATVFIYSLSDYKLIKKFGKKGEGPQEFKHTPEIIPLKDKLQMNTRGKMSYYTKDGEFINERRVTSSMVFRLLPLKEGFIGLGFDVDKNILYRSLNFYDKDLNKSKQIYRVKFREVRGAQEIPGPTMAYEIVNDKIFVINSYEFEFDILDQSGNKIKSIKKDHKRRPFTKEDETKIHEILKLMMGQAYEARKAFIKLPSDYWPAIMAMLTDGEKVYIPTWHIKDEKIQFFIYDADGNEIKNIYIPFVFRDAYRPFPFRVADGKLYQVIENEDEEWELHISKIE